MCTCGIFVMCVHTVCVYNVCAMCMVCVTCMYDLCLRYVCAYEKSLCDLCDITVYMVYDIRDVSDVCVHARCVIHTPHVWLCMTCVCVVYISVINNVNV